MLVSACDLDVISYIVAEVILSLLQFIIVHLTFNYHIIFHKTTKYYTRIFS